MGALKEARGVAMRYEKLAVHYLALVKLGMIRMLVKRLERPGPTPTPGRPGRVAPVDSKPAGRPLTDEAEALVRSLS